MDVASLLDAFDRPESDLSSLHPALLNAMYLGACSVNGHPLERFKSHFLERTRFYMHQSLACADRLTHFLWASVILGAFLVREYRLAEAYAVVSACARFAIACGLETCGSNNASTVASTSHSISLLDPPSNEEDEGERTRLANAIFMMDRLIAHLGYFPRVFMAPLHPISSRDFSAMRDVPSHPPSYSVSARYLLLLMMVHN